MTLTFIAYSLLIVLVSLVGGWVPMMVRLTHRRMQFATSLIAGFMLGVALLHLLPHALFAIDPLPAMLAVLGGVLAMFFLERFFHSHQHIAPGEDGKPPVTADPEPHTPADCEHDAGDPIDHHHGHTHTRLSWVGVSVGLLIHSLIGGAALGAAMLAEGHLFESLATSAHPSQGGLEAIHQAHPGKDGPVSGFFDHLPGLAVFLVIVLHRPFDSMTLLTLLRTTGWSRGLQHTVNVLFALLVPLGAGLMFAGLAGDDLKHSEAVGYALAVAAGVFLCVALADLLPEVHFHRHDRVGLSVAVLLGLALAYAIAHGEAGTHAHEHGHGGHPSHADHDVHGHGSHEGHDHGTHDGHDHHDHDHENHGHEHDDHGAHDHDAHDHDHGGHDHAGHAH